MSTSMPGLRLETKGRPVSRYAVAIGTGIRHGTRIHVPKHIRIVWRASWGQWLSPPTVIADWHCGGWTTHFRYGDVDQLEAIGYALCTACLGRMADS